MLFVIVMSNDRHEKFSSRFQSYWTFLRFEFDAFISRHEFLTAAKRAEKVLAFVYQMT